VTLDSSLTFVTFLLDNDKMLGVRKNEAEHDLVHAKKKKKVRSAKTERE